MGNDFSKKLDTEEKELAEKLKLLCDENGKETSPTESAGILHQLGRVYHERGKQDGDKMICWIQSAALFNAALIRTKNTLEIQKDLKQLCNDILIAADANDKSADLIDQSIRVKKKIKSLRNYVSEQLKDIPQIPSDQLPNSVVGRRISDQKVADSWFDSRTGNASLFSWKRHFTLICHWGQALLTEPKKVLSIGKQQKTSLVRKLQHDITEQYKQIMEYVASYCHDVMGDAPCKFAIIGMGSLARKEITPFSDFEHVIALADKAKENLDEAEWQNVLDYFRWFSVIFQIILINLQETILPSVAIPSLNDSYSDIQKNDWFFDDITPSGISFDGMMPYACKFPLGRRKLTKNKRFETELIKPVKEMLKYLKGDAKLKPGYHLDDILTKTCFVYGDEVINEEFNHGVTEILSRQNDEEKTQSVKQQINEDIEKFATRSTVFQMNLRNEINIKKVAYRNVTLFVAAYGRKFGFCESSCFDIIEKLKEKDGFNEYSKESLMYAVAMACEIRLRWYMKHQRQTDIIKSNLNDARATEIFSSIIGKASILQYFRIAYALQCDISNRLHLKRLYFHSNPQLLNLGLQLCFEKSNQVLRISHKNFKHPTTDRLRKFDDCLDLLEKDSNINQSTNSQNNIISKKQSLNQIGDILLSMGCYDDAVDYYKLSLHATIENDRANNDASVAHSLFNLGQCLVQINRPREALTYFIKLKDISEQAISNAECDTSLAKILYQIGQCLLKMNLATDALEYYNTALKIFEKTTLDAEFDTNLAKSLYDIGRCLLKMNRKTKALECYNKALKIEEQATLNASSDLNIATTLDGIGRLLLEMNQFTEALEYYSRALKIRDLATLNANIDTNLAYTLHDIDQCLLEMNRATEALEYYIRALKIFKKATLNDDIDTNIASTLSEIVLCVLQINQATEA